MIPSSCCRLCRQLDDTGQLCRRTRYRRSSYTTPRDTIDTGHLTTTMFSENLGAVPGRVLYDQLTTWLDGASSGAFLFNASEDVLYVSVRFRPFRFLGWLPVEG